jgi:hypothetical protein
MTEATNHPTIYYDALDNAVAFRGHYILSQALSIAITQLESVDDPYKEESNIADMKYFRKNVWDFPEAAFLPFDKNALST